MGSTHVPTVLRSKMCKTTSCSRNGANRTASDVAGELGIISFVACTELVSAGHA